MNNRRLSLAAVFTIIAVFICGILPSANVYAAGSNEPQIKALAAASFDMKTGELIYTKGADNKMYPASMTKLMTALLFAENKKKSDLIPYTEDAMAQPQYSLHTDIMRTIKIGDTMTADDVMKALLLFSANDSAYMIADSVGGNPEAFAKMMNDKAAELGMTGTNYVTANGLHDENHYTTPYNMLLLVKAAYANPWIKEVMQTKSARISTTSGLWAMAENRNKLLGQDGNMGGKTGSTVPAGRCLISVYEKDGRTIAGVVMHDDFNGDENAVFSDMQALMDWSFAQKPAPVYQKSAAIKTVNVTYKPFVFFGAEKSVALPIVVKDDVSLYDNEINKKEFKPEIKLLPIHLSKLSTDTKVGTLTVSIRGYKKTYDLYPGNVPQNIKFTTIGMIALSIGAVVVVIVVILLLLLLIIRGINRGKRRGSKRNRYY